MGRPKKVTGTPEIIEVVNEAPKSIGELLSRYTPFSEHVTKLFKHLEHAKWQITVDTGFQWMKAVKRFDYFNSIELMVQGHTHGNNVVFANIEITPASPKRKKNNGNSYSSLCRQINWVPIDNIHSWKSIQEIIALEEYVDIVAKHGMNSSTYNYGAYTPEQLALLEECRGMDGVTVQEAWNSRKPIKDKLPDSYRVVVPYDADGNKYQLTINSGMVGDIVGIFNMCQGYYPHSMGTFRVRDGFHKVQTYTDLAKLIHPFGKI